MMADKKMTSIEKNRKINSRTGLIFVMALAGIFLLYVLIHGSFITDANLTTDFENKLDSPSIEHIFGTDAVGRDMYLRTIKGLSLSLVVGTIASLSSVIISIIFAILLTAFGEKTDAVVNWIIDVFLSVPSTVLLIVISVCAGRGLRGVIIGIALTHWTALTRILRTEILELKQEKYIQVSKAMGKSKLNIAINHILVSVLPQVIVGFVLLFPHAVLHEAGITFLGFGLGQSTPAIGVILAESMNYIVQGYWYLAVCPGIVLILIVLCINFLGENLKSYVNPHSYHR